MSRLYRAASTLLLCLIASFLFAAPPPYIPIAKARQATPGTTVTVLGLVTVPSGDFSSSSGDEGFAIQDQTGGIWISVAKNPGLRLGQRVQVTGKLDFNEKVQIDADAGSVKVLAGDELRVATGQVGQFTLGYIITIEGTITADGVVPDGNDGAKVYLNDGTGKAMVYLNKSTDINASAPYLKPGRVLRVTGFGNQYGKGSFEVDPRSRRDITPR